ncbi:dynactin subunit 6 [Ischnura elegans]|uniref:dynactin subunit 6 n=1 Tax=Ischnura elegans TaxID=197161 RepID=UPI001ED8B545|nr:dynactin subunit 6 [Ischnura elegans]
MAAKRPASGVKSNIKIAPGAIVCKECEIRGDVTIGSMTVIHPKASIIAEDGPIIIGESNIIEEQVRIVNRLPAELKDGQRPSPVMIIGANNVFEVDCYCEALKIGDYNNLEPKSYVGREVELSNGCIVGAKCKLTKGQVLKENTVIYGSNSIQRVQADRPPSLTSQLDFLIRIIPNYHHLIKSVKKT